MYNTFMVVILQFFITQNTNLSPKGTTILQMIVTVLIFTPLQLLMFVPKILYATGVMTMKERIVLNKGAARSPATGAKDSTAMSGSQGQSSNGQTSQ
jgi:hypothetical protein